MALRGERAYEIVARKTPRMKRKSKRFVFKASVNGRPVAYDFGGKPHIRNAFSVFLDRLSTEDCETQNIQISVSYE